MQRLHVLLRRTSFVTVVTVFATILVQNVWAESRRSLPQTPADFQRLAGPQYVVPMPMEVENGNPQSVHLRFTDPPLERGTYEANSRSYSVVRLSGESSTAQEGEPDLPCVTRLVMIGNTGNADLNILQQSYSVEALTADVLPYQPLDGNDHKDFVTPKSAIYSRDTWYPPVVAEISEPATLRDVRFVVVTVYPVQVNPVTREIRVYNDIEVLISNSGGFGANEIHIIPTSITPDFKKLYTTFANFRGSTLDELPVSPGKYLVICDSLSSIVEQAQKLVSWKKQRGIDASLARVQVEIGGTSLTNIRDYVVQQYQASNGQLEYVCLIGDATTSTASTWAIPTSSTQLDNYYGTLPDNAGPNPDPLPDLAVGRISCFNLSQLAFIVNKTVAYESAPDTTDTGWFTRGWCVAHTHYAPSNTSIKRYTQQIMQMRGLDPVYFNSYYDETDIDTLNAHLSDGISVFNQRMSWISEMVESDLDNCPASPRLPFVATITCNTGTFLNTTTLSEKWLRPQDSPDPSVARGAIGAIGLSGSSTHTRLNNIMDAGIMYGLYALDIQSQGVALIAGKMELYRNYTFVFPDTTKNFCYWTNLMGDPSVPIWREFPAASVVSAPTSVPVLTNNVTIGVTRGGTPVEDAYVSLLKGSETFVSGYTNAAGTVNLPVTLTSTGSLIVTITKEDLYPQIDTIQVVSAAASLAYYSVTVDDDNNGGTSGDGNGIINPGETADLTIRLQNAGTSQTVSSINTTLSCASPGITITSAASAYPNIAVGANAAPTTLFRVQAGALTDGEALEFHLAATSSAGSQNIRADITPAAAGIAYVSRTVQNANNRLDPGETVNMTVTFNNAGSRALTAASGILRSLDSHVTVNDSLGTYGAVGVGSNAENSSNMYNVTADPWTAAGYPARMLLIITDTNGFRDSTEYTDTIGVASATSPTGPDAYGYYAYDENETQPSGAACVSQWIEIWNQGGTSLNFTDNAQNKDTSVTLSLPFGFKFYGEVFNQITVCSNGWLAFGSYPINDFRNYRIGGPLGPPNQVAAYWDDLKAAGTDSNVYYRYDSGAHIFIVEWRARTLWTNVTEFFQIILYDTTYYPSPTGDGKIKIQYQLLTPSANQDPSPNDDNPWASVGIQNGNHTVGLEYSYWNNFAPGSAPLGNDRAIMFTTDVTGYIPTTLMLGSPNGGETWFQHTAGTVTWLGGDQDDNVVIELSRNGTAGPWETIAASTTNDRSHTFTVSGPTSSTCRVRISMASDPLEADTTEADFAISALQVESPNGGEVWMADSAVSITWQGGDPAANVRIDLLRNGLSGPWQTIDTSTVNTGSYSLTAPLPTSTTCRVRVKSLSDTTDIDESDADFSILTVQNVLTENCESGASGWTHSTPGGQWVDNWHISTERAYMGAMSFKCGAQDTGVYSGYCDSRLLSPVIADLPTGARLYFAHQYQSETSSYYADSAYDGGILEISADGGAFTQITPVGGYPRVLRYMAGGTTPASGPMPGQRCFADSINPTWRITQVDLSAYAGQDIQLRFRFGSDARKGYEGWYVDDIQITAPVSSPWSPVQPVAVTIKYSNGNVILNWADDGNLFYRIYYATNASGPYSTEASWWTEQHEFTVPGGPATLRMFYLVVGWNGE
jgi:hypothetical protein